MLLFCPAFGQMIEYMMDNDSRLESAAERRASRRYPIHEEASYKTLDHRYASPESGNGETVDISSGGILFATERHLACGRRVEVSVNWPAHLWDGCPLKFVAVGRVVRVDDHRAAVSIEQYQFKTRRSKENATDTAADKPSRDALPYH